MKSESSPLSNFVEKEKPELFQDNVDIEKTLSRQKLRAIAISVVLLVLLCDQVIKFFVKTNMMLHHHIELIGQWAQLYFTENAGMAFGLNFMGTIFLCSLRIVAVVILIYFLHKIVKLGASCGFIICIALVLAGAAGNIFDNVFYGLIFTESTDYSVASLVPFGEGYGGLFSGQVVDMFYFPIIDTFLPSWVPFRGGCHFVFFAPIFNLADSAITCGGIALILFYRHSFSRFFNSSQKTGSDTSK